MRLDTLMLAEAARAVEGKLYLHAGGITRIEAPFLPWIQPQIAVVIRFALDGGDRGMHELAVTMRGPAGELNLPRAVFPLPCEDPMDLEVEDAFVNLALTVSPILFQNLGVHHIEVEVDGAGLGSARLRVLAASQMSAHGGPAAS